MNNEFYDVEKADKILNKAVGCYCPHCGELSYDRPMTGGIYSFFSGPASRICDFCGKKLYRKVLISVIKLVAIALLILAVILFESFNSVVSLIICLALSLLTEVASLVISFVDSPRTYYTTLLNSYEFGERIYLKPHKAIRKKRFYRKGQMCEVRCANISVESVAVGQVDFLTDDLIVLRIVKNDNLEFDIGQNVSVEPLIGKKAYATVSDIKQVAFNGKR